MSHYHAEVWVPTNEDVGTQIQDIMVPYRECWRAGGRDGFFDYCYLTSSRRKDIVISVLDVAEDLICELLITPWGMFYQGQGEHFWFRGSNTPPPAFDGNIFRKLQELGITDGFLVAVGYHK